MQFIKVFLEKNYFFNQEVRTNLGVFKHLCIKRTFDETHVIKSVSFISDRLRLNAQKEKKTGAL